jgi:hypothetical protein
MRRTVAFATLIIASAIVAATVGGSPRLAHASSLVNGGATANVPLPAVQQSSAETITFSVTAPAGKTVGPLRVQTVNNAKLGNLAVVYVIGTPKKASAHESVTVSVFIKRFVSRRLARREGDPVVTLKVIPVGVKTGVGEKLTIDKTSRFKCDDLKFFDNAFETGRVKVSDNGGFWTLVNGRDEHEQPSPPEEVLDNIMGGIEIPAGCDFKPEGDDPGNK